MADNLGKKFEEQFKGDFKSLPNVSIDRLYDLVSGYKSISQVCDFIGYIYPNIYYLECKSTQGNTLNFAKIRQYDELVKKVGIKGVRSGVVVWFIDHDRVLYVPTKTLTEMKKNGDKSVNIRTIDKYRYLEIPSIKKRVFMNSDYSVLTTLQEGD